MPYSIFFLQKNASEENTALLSHSRQQFERIFTRFDLKSKISPRSRTNADINNRKNQFPQSNLL
jgi:hypothetical protein